MKGAIRNDLDWFLASVCVRNEPVVRSSKQASSRSLTWINTYLIHAKDLAEAFDKAVKIGKSEQNQYKVKGGLRKWRFVGIWDLQLIWDDLADGEEMFWTDYGRITNRIARRRCITKQQLLRGSYGPTTAEKVSNKPVRPTKASRVVRRPNRKRPAGGSRR